MTQIATEKNTRLSTVQVQAIELLQSGISFNETAEQVGVSRSTLYRWRQDPHFAAILSARDDDRLDDAKRRLLGLIDDVITTLNDILNDRTKSEHARLRAAQLILEYHGKLKETMDVIKRIEAIEEKLK